MGNKESQTQKLFKQIDKDKDGNVDLNDLWNNTSSSLIPDLCSLLTLFHFDMNRDGKLDFEEFKKMKKYVSKVVRGVEATKLDTILDNRGKKHKKREEKFERIFFQPRNSILSEKEVEIVISREIYDRLMTKKKKKMDSAEKIIERLLNDFDRKEQHRRDKENEYVEMFTADYYHDIVGSVVSLRKRINGKIGLSTIFRKGKRVEFLEWLFKVADSDNDSKIKLKDLKSFLRFIEHDEIDLDFLLFEPHKVKFNKSNYPERIMKEYDLNQTGALEKEEFFRLGDLVLSFYQLKEKLGRQEVIGDWRLKHLLGKGSYGEVYFSVNNVTHEKIAIKILPKGNGSKMSQLDVEIKAMKLLNHKNIVKLYSVSEDENKIYLHIEICGGGALFEHLGEQPLDEELARYYFSQIVNGVQYCHKKGVCHRDLRLENLLLDNQGNVKISDFGQSKIFNQGWDLCQSQITSNIYNTSPEQIEGKIYSGEKMDIWSLGLILYSFLTAKLPFTGPEVKDMFNAIKIGKYSWPEDISISEEAKSMVNGLLQVNPKDRLTLTEIKKHKWLKEKKRPPREFNVYNMVINNVLSETPNRRKMIFRMFEKILKQNKIHCFYRHYNFKKEKAKVRFRCINPFKFLKFFLYIHFQKDNSLNIKCELIDGESLRFKKVLKKSEDQLVGFFKTIEIKGGVLEEGTITPRKFQQPDTNDNGGSKTDV